jgi:hypothetical protein
LVELTKDLGALQIYGRDIVVGVDEEGSPTGELTDDEARLFDEAILRSKIERYLSGFDIRGPPTGRVGTKTASPNPARIPTRSRRKLR